jgi:hypothetical protein
VSVRRPKEAYLVRDPFLNALQHFRAKIGELLIGLVGPIDEVLALGSTLNMRRSPI